VNDTPSIKGASWDRYSAGRVCVGHLDPKAPSDEEFTGAWLRGTNHRQDSPGYVGPNDLCNPMLKFFDCVPGSIYTHGHGHARTVPAHKGQRYEYVWVLNGTLSFTNTNGPPTTSPIGLGDAPIELNPWDRATWYLPKSVHQASV